MDSSKGGKAIISHRSTEKGTEKKKVKRRWSDFGGLFYCLSDLSRVWMIPLVMTARGGVVANS